MNFLAPAFAWTFVSLIPLAAIYFLKVRPRRKTTSAYFLWEKIFTEKKSSSLFSRLRDLWSLLLMLLAFAAVALALMQPEFDEGERKDLMILVDHSASMSTDDGGSTRLESALGEARRIVRALDGVQRAAVAAVAREVRFVSHLTESPRELVDALGRIEPTSLPLDLRALESLDAGADEQWTDRYRILFITDGSFEADVALPETIELLKVGEPRENLGIAAADARLLPGEEPSVNVYVQIASSYRERREIDLIFGRRDSETLGKIIPLEITPGLNTPEVFAVEGFGPGEYVVSLDIDDALTIDNRANISILAPEPVTVSVDTEDRFFFENSVLAFAQAGGLLQLVPEGGQLAIAKSKTPDAALSLIFFPSGESTWWQDPGEELASPVPRVTSPEHPILRMLDAGAMAFTGARRLKAPEQALILVESDQGIPLIYVARQSGRSAVVVNMDPLLAEFYFSTRFPVLVHNAATYLAGREETLASTYPAGATAVVPGVRDDDPAEATSPEGTVMRLSGKDYGPLTSLGFHEIRNASDRWPIAVSLLSPAESLLDNTVIADTSRPIRRGWSLAYLFTAMAIVVLCLESILYHRRKVG